jgi:hypothetical protein
MAFCPLNGRVSSSTARCPLYDTLSSLRFPSSFPFYGPLSSSVPFSVLFPLYGPLLPLYDPLTPLRPSVASAALCLLYTPIPLNGLCPLYGPLYPPQPSVPRSPLSGSIPPLRPSASSLGPSVTSAALCHLYGPLSPLRSSAPTTAICPPYLSSILCHVGSMYRPVYVIKYMNTSSVPSP